jgi:predicted dehydrogenase
MSAEKITIGFLGAGSIAISHAYALTALKYYYTKVPDIDLYSVCSARKESSESFAAKYGFRKSLQLEQFISDSAINTVFILGPNQVHFELFKLALKMRSVERIYLEKPVCSCREEEIEMAYLASKSDIKVQIGFQFLQTASVREALIFWKTGKLGQAIHFDIKYFHGDYLQFPYREKRTSRLTSAPNGGAMADLGSHALSLLIAFLGNQFKITSAIQAGKFPDVRVDSDLFSSINLVNTENFAAGTVAASRISSGSGDLISIDIYAEKGMLRYSSIDGDSFSYFLEETNQWTKQVVGSNYDSLSKFPSGHVSPGWLRAMIHAHYLFFDGIDTKTFIPDLQHGLDVQRLVRETSENLKTYRELIQ